MPSQIYFVSYPEDFSEPSLDFKKGEELLEFIRNDSSLKIEPIGEERMVHYFFDEHWQQFFSLESDGDIYLNFRVVEDAPELYYKLTELAKALDLCLEVEDVLVFIPQFGLLLDLEDPEEGVKCEIYGYEIHEKIADATGITVKDAIRQIEHEKSQ